MKKPAQGICCSWHHNPHSLLNQHTTFSISPFLNEVICPPFPSLCSLALVAFCPFSILKSNGRIFSRILANLGVRLTHFHVGFQDFIPLPFWPVRQFRTITTSSKISDVSLIRDRMGVVFPLLFPLFSQEAFPLLLHSTVTWMRQATCFACANL